MWCDRCTVLKITVHTATAVVQLPEIHIGDSSINVNGFMLLEATEKKLRATRKAMVDWPLRELFSRAYPQS